MVLDYLSCGIDPHKSKIYLQSAVHEVYEMNLFFEMLVTVPRLQRMPSLKDMAKAADFNEMPFGLLGYPVLQAADILMPRANLVPVGKDNEAHVELSREIARRFNSMYGEVFPVPDVMVGDVPTLVGTDGDAKMSKSLGNAIMLSDDVKTVNKKVRSMYTDPNRISADNTDKAEVEDLKIRYKLGKVGDVEVKDKLAAAINGFLEPLRERRAEFERQPGLVDEVVFDGTMAVCEEARQTVSAMKKAMGLAGVWNSISRKAEKARKKREKDAAQN
jgi:tryptophanyl-tRNA synthetase